MKYIIFDSRTGLECGGSIEHIWNSMEECKSHCYGRGGSTCINEHTFGHSHGHHGCNCNSTQGCLNGHGGAHGSGMFPEEPKLRALLLFFMDSLRDDINNLAYVQGTAEKNILDDTSKAARALAYFISVSEERNLPLVRRTVELAISEVEHATFLLSRLPMINDISLDNHIGRRPEYLVELKVNFGFSDTVIAHLRNAIHDYIVARVLWEWARLTYPKFADYWKEKFEADLVTIKEEVDRGDADVNARIVPAW